MEPLHEFLAMAIYQAAAFSTYRLRNQEAAVRRKQRGWVELYVLQVDTAGPGAIGHGDTVAARARRVRRMKEDAPKPAAREDCLLGQDRKNLSPRWGEKHSPRRGSAAKRRRGARRSEAPP